MFGSVAAVSVAIVLLVVPSVRAQNVETGDASRPTQAVEAKPTEADGPRVTTLQNDRIFGILPNYGTVERDTTSVQLTNAQKFKLAGLGSFDPYVFPYVGMLVGLGQGGQAAYARRYATALADNSIGNFLTSAILPAALHQDPRYYARGSGRVLGRAGYALSRSVVTRSSAGHAQFNYSEIAGNLSAATIGNLYCSSANRSSAGTLTRFEGQVLSDALANEMKEFWPDIRGLLGTFRRARH
jgi:hypothetical protein